MTPEDIFVKVRDTLVDALGVDDDEVTLESRLEADLGAESIDFLDIVFRLEKNFGIKIPRGELFPEDLASANSGLVKDGRMYSGLRLSKDGNTAFLTVTEGNRPGDIYTSDGSLSNLRRFSESNPQLTAKRFGPTELLSYLDADGHQKNAVVHYPSGYEKGKAYPTVFIIYEDFFDDSFDVAANLLGAQGYVVVKPSVDFETGYPGEAWLKGVTGAANKLIGEVSLKNATPNTTYMVAVSVGDDNCMPEGTLTTNGQGNGNAHLADPTLSNGSFYVVLTDAAGDEAFASAPVSVN